MSERKSTGFSKEEREAVNLNDGAMWPTAFAIKDLDPSEEERIKSLVRRAVS